MELFDDDELCIGKFSRYLKIIAVGFISAARFIDELPPEDGRVVAVLHLGDTIHPR